jgi:hypothetical protein
MLDGDVVLVEVNTAGANAEDPLLRERVNMEHDFTPLASLNVPFEATKMKYVLAQNESIVGGTESILTQYTDATIEGQNVTNIKLSIVHHYKLDAFQKTMEDNLNVKTLLRVSMFFRSVAVDALLIEGKKVEVLRADAVDASVAHGVINSGWSWGAVPPALPDGGWDKRRIDPQELR